MTIRRRCTERNCKNGRRCLEHLRFDVMFRGKRYRIPANEFAIPRMEPGKQRPIQSMEEARDWERLFIGEIKAGPRSSPASSRTMQAGSELATSRRSSMRTWSAASSRQGCAASPPSGAGSAFSKSTSAAAAAGARGSGRDQPVQDRIGVRGGRGDRDDAPRPRNAARGDELGHGADAAAVQPSRRFTGSASG